MATQPQNRKPLASMEEAWAARESLLTKRESLRAESESLWAEGERLLSEARFAVRHTAEALYGSGVEIDWIKRTATARKKE